MLRGVALVLPPVLTLVILIGVWNVLRGYLLEPLTGRAREALAWSIEDIRFDLSGETAEADGQTYLRLGERSYVPAHVLQTVRAATPPRAVPNTPHAVYLRYVELRYLQRKIAIPSFAAIVVLSMYLVGRFLAARVGRYVYEVLERVIGRLPLVRSVYSSVKHVTDLMLNEDPVRKLRVVAVQYPRPGVWAVAYVTGEGLEDISRAMGEPTVSLLVPTSPKAITGFTAIVPRSRTVELDLTLEEAVQFLISCGVVVPSPSR